MFRLLRTKARSSGPRPASRRRRDRRLAAIVATVVAIGLAGGAAHWFSSRTASPAAAERAADPRTDAAGHASQARAKEIRDRFEQSVMMLHAKQYEHAATALHRLLELAPEMPEAHANMGYAMLGLKRYEAARDFFEGATALRPQQVNAYYGLAVSLEELGDLPGAMGAMRTYIHLSKGDDPFVRKARSALWEWESRLAETRGAAAKPGKKP